MVLTRVAVKIEKNWIDLAVGVDRIAAEGM